MKHLRTASAAVFAAMLQGLNHVELLKTGKRPYREGDTEYVQEIDSEDGFTGKELQRSITEVISGPGLKPGYAVICYRNEQADLVAFKATTINDEWMPLPEIETDPEEPESVNDEDVPNEATALTSQVATKSVEDKAIATGKTKPVTGIKKGKAAVPALNIVVADEEEDPNLNDDTKQLF